MATYIPNATQTTEPVESRTVESAALEFRTLKSSINSRISEVAADLTAEEAARIAADAFLQTTNNAQDVRIQAIESALLAIGEGGLPGTVYVQRLSGTGVQTAFTLNVEPRTEALIDIFINGVYQQKDSFTVAGSLLTFSEAPPAGTNNIEVVISVTLANVETDASLVSYYPTESTVTPTTVEAKLRERVSVKDFGAVGDGVTDDTAAIQAAFSASSSVHFPEGIYNIAFDVSASGLSCVTLQDKRGIYITGRGATIKDVSVYAGSFLTNIFKFVRCNDIYVDVNFDATPLANPTAPSPDGIGYQGSAALYFEEGCTNITVCSRIDNTRYGVRSGDYTNTTAGYCSGFTLKITSSKCGYPAALYLADDIEVNIQSDYQHRALYLAGCANVRGTVTYTGVTYAANAVLLTSSLTAASVVDSDRRARGCSRVKLRAVDNGSVGTMSNRSIYGIAYQWKAPDTSFDDIDLHVNAKTTDANRTLAAFRLENSFEWYATNRYSNLKLSGIIDRSLQTLGASSWANISIDGITSGEASPYPTAPIFQNISFDDFVVLNASVTGNHEVLRIPNLVGSLTFNRVAIQNVSLIARSGRVNVYDSTLGNLVTGNIVASLSALNSTIGSVGAGIAYQNISTTAGTFSPVLIGGTTAGEGTYTAQVGHWTRVGNLVTIFGNLGWSAHTGSGNMKIAGLPFPAAASKGFCPIIVVPVNITSPAGSVIAAMVPQNEAAITLYSITTQTAAFATLAMDTAGSLWFSGTYEAAP